MFSFVLTVLVQFKPPKSFKFPTRLFGNGDDARLRACKSEWFDDFGWMHYDATDDYVLCYQCVIATKKGRFTIQ